MHRFIYKQTLVSTEGIQVEQEMENKRCVSPIHGNLIMQDCLMRLDPFQEHDIDYQYINSLIEQALQGH